MIAFAMLVKGMLKLVTVSAPGLLPHSACSFSIWRLEPMWLRRCSRFDMPHNWPQSVCCCRWPSPSCRWRLVIR